MRARRMSSREARPSCSSTHSINSLHSSSPSLLDVELGNVQADDSAAKALCQRTAMIASATTDIEEERGSADSTGGGDLPRGWPTYAYRPPPSVLSYQA